MGKLGSWNCKSLTASILTGLSLVLFAQYISLVFLLLYGKHPSPFHLIHLENRCYSQLKAIYVG
jgi:hypothetical protein